MNVATKRADNATFTLEQIWFELLTEEMYYNNCKLINLMALKFLNRSYNECIVNQTFPALEVEKHNFIATNGLHSLVSMNLVEDMLTNRFGKNWHFTMYC